MRYAIIPVVVGLLVSPLAAADDAEWARSIERAARDYRQQLEAATAELVAARVRIAAERVPVEETRRAQQQQVLTLEALLARVESEQAQEDVRLAQLKAELEGLNRNLAYLTSLGRDALKGLDEALLPGEAATLAEPIAALTLRAANPASQHDPAFIAGTSDLIMHRLRQMIGGHRAPGTSLFAGDNEVVPGTFLWLGPEVFFRADRDGAVGTVRSAEGMTQPLTYPLAPADSAQTQMVFQGGPGLFAADSSGGKALQLQEARGTLADHIKKGGIVGYVILGLGALSAIITLMKLADLRLLAVDEPGRVSEVARALAQGARNAAEAAIGNLRATTRELFALGLKYADAPKVVLEEHLEGFVLQQRLHHERRLPLLAVIATAGPLLGLLGTVTGMIRTFTLIKVYGGGGAEKLAGGISEALVATFLGLAVAIPTLVIHGFLSHRVHKGLAMLERYALEFVTAVEESRGKPEPEEILRS